MNYNELNMEQTTICPFCKEIAELKYFTYTSTKKDKEGKVILMPNTSYYLCSNLKCGHNWMDEYQCDLLSEKLKGLEK